MFKKAGALLLVAAGIASWVSCSTNVNHYVFAAVPAASEILVYREDPNAGVLTALTNSPISAGQAVQALALHPSKQFLYAANSGENDISLFTVSAGTLTEVTPRTQVGSSPQFLAIDAAGSYLYVVNTGFPGSISAFTINASTGALAAVGSSPFTIGIQPESMVLAPSGNFIYMTGAGSPALLEVWSLNAGVPTILQVEQTGSNFDGIVINPAGTYLYTANKLDSSISEFAICPNSSAPVCATQAAGTVAELPGSPIFTSGSAPVALLVDQAGAFLYAAQTGLNSIALYSIGSDGGLTVQTTAGSPFTSNSQPTLIASDPSGKYFFVENQSGPAIQSFSVNTSTGALTSVASYSIGSGAAFSVVVTTQ